jgi:hypothetical protein
MVGGIVANSIHDEEKEIVNIEVASKRYSDTCRIKVEMNNKSRSVSVGDTVWWQGDFVYWTPYKKRSNNMPTGPEDIKLKRVGYYHKIN